MTKRCVYCGRFYQSKEFSKKCKECDKELQKIKERLQFDGVLKGLATG